MGGWQALRTFLLMTIQDRMMPLQEVAAGLMILGFGVPDPLVRKGRYFRFFSIESNGLFTAAVSRKNPHA